MSKINLAGVWYLRLDPKGQLKADDLRETNLSEWPMTMRLPGSMTVEGIGDPIEASTRWVGSIFDRSWFTEARYSKYREAGRVKVPFWLQPETYYAAAAWYARDVEVPSGWEGMRVVLGLERPHGKVTVWWNGRELGERDSLATPHVFEVGCDVRPGTHRLLVRVDNSPMDIGENSHSISDHTQGNWNGVVGRIELRATRRRWVEKLMVDGQAETKSVRVWGQVQTAEGLNRASGVRLNVTEMYRAGAKGFGYGDGVGRVITTGRVSLDDQGRFDVELSLGESARLWDEFDQTLYRLEVVPDLPSSESSKCDDDVEPRTTTFGLRDVRTQGRRILINGRIQFFRGTLDCCIFPLTGHPPTDVDSWRRVMGVVRAHGLNHVRFHSYCPPEAAFIAADEMGIYLQIEASTWPNQSTTIGDGKFVDSFLMRETEAILNAYGNHPSFVMMASGNEPAGERHVEFLGEWLKWVKSIDRRRIYTVASGWPEHVDSDYHVLPAPRIQQWGEELKSRINSTEPSTVSDYRVFVAARDVPVISHEIGQWCVFPNLEEIGKYKGPLKPRNFEIFRDTLDRNGLLHQANDFLMASGKLQALCYREEIESALRTPEFGGFQLLGLQDFPGQGTALVGVVDPFWESKGYVTAEEFRQFCGPVVLLARLPRRVFTAGDSITADVDLSNYGRDDLRSVMVDWILRDVDGDVVAQGEVGPVDVAQGESTRVGRISSAIDSVKNSARWSLDLQIRRAAIANSYSVWVYANEGESMAGRSTITTDPADAERRLERGERVFLMLSPERLAMDVGLGFSSIFWNTAWTSGQKPHTLGVLCDPKHPALAGFPTSFHSDWQWWYLVRRAGAFVMDDLPRELTPIVQVVDDWVTGRKLGLVFEAKVGAGRLLLCTADLLEANDPVCRQMMRSLCSYIASDDFYPRVEVPFDSIRSNLKRHAQA